MAYQAQGDGVTSFRVATQAELEVFEHIFGMIFGQDLGKTGVTTRAAVFTRVGLYESAMAGAPLPGMERIGKERDSTPRQPGSRFLFPLRTPDRVFTPCWAVLDCVRQQASPR